MVHGNRVEIDSLCLGDNRDEGKSDNNDSADVQTKSVNTIPTKLNSFHK